MYYGYYGYPDGYNITSDLSVIFDEKIRKQNVKFERTGHLSREYERQRFKHRGEHETIVLEGKCENCNERNIVVWPYIEYRRRFAELEADDLIRFDCQKCERKGSCVIPNF